MAADRAIPDTNNNFSLNAVSSTDGITPVNLWADPVTHQLLANTSAEGASGIGTDTTLTLTAASTSYQVPASPPASAYLLMLYNGSDTDMFITFTSTTTGGVKLAAGANLNIDLGASQTLFAYSGGTGKVLNVSHKVI